MRPSRHILRTFFFSLLIGLASHVGVSAQTAPGNPIRPTEGCSNRMECLRKAADLLWDKYSREIETALAEYKEALAGYEKAQRDRFPDDRIAAAKRLLDLKEEKYQHARSV